MKALVGTVVDGKVEVPAEVIAEGARVMVLSPESDEPIRLSLAEERELADAIEQIRRGEFIDGDDLLKELRSRRPRP